MSQNEEITERLQQFMAAMRDWECAYGQAQRELMDSGVDTAKCDNDYKIQLKLILDKFSLDRGRNWARLIDLGCGSPPTYDPDRDAIESPILDGKKYSIVVRQAVRLKAVYRFYFELLNNSWVIVKKETQQAEKWKQTAL